MSETGHNRASSAKRLPEAPDDLARRDRALADIARANEEAGLLGGGMFQRAAGRLSGHLTADDAGSDDRTEIWGRRVGRGLAVMAFFGLLIHLWLTYIA